MPYKATRAWMAQIVGELFHLFQSVTLPQSILAVLSQGLVGSEFLKHVRWRQRNSCSAAHTQIVLSKAKEPGEPRYEHAWDKAAMALSADMSP